MPDLKYVALTPMSRMGQAEIDTPTEFLKDFAPTGQILEEGKGGGKKPQKQFAVGHGSGSPPRRQIALA